MGSEEVVREIRQTEKIAADTATARLFRDIRWNTRILCLWETINTDKTKMQRTTKVSLGTWKGLMLQGKTTAGVRTIQNDVTRVINRCKDNRIDTREFLEPPAPGELTGTTICIL